MILYHRLVEMSTSFLNYPKVYKYHFSACEKIPGVKAGDFILLHSQPYR